MQRYFPPVSFHFIFRSLQFQIIHHSSTYRNEHTVSIPSHSISNEHAFSAVCVRLNILFLASIHRHNLWWKGLLLVRSRGPLYSCVAADYWDDTMPCWTMVHLSSYDHQWKPTLPYVRPFHTLRHSSHTIKRTPMTCDIMKTLISKNRDGLVLPSCKYVTAAQKGHRKFTITFEKTPALLE